MEENIEQVKKKRQISPFATLSQKQKILTVINYTTCFLLSSVLISFAITILILDTTRDKLVTCICCGLCYLLPFVVQWIFRSRISPVLISIYLVFLTVAGFLGSCLGLNDVIPHFDKIQHFSWGYIACFAGLFLLCRSKDIDKLKPIMVIIFFMGLSLATASVWELIEFAGDSLLGQTAQGTPINGITPVGDSMWDILMHTCGTILFTIHFCLDKFTHKNLGITAAINDFKKDY